MDDCRICGTKIPEKYKGHHAAMGFQLGTCSEFCSYSYIHGGVYAPNEKGKTELFLNTPNYMRATAKYGKLKVRRYEKMF